MDKQQVCALCDNEGFEPVGNWGFTMGVCTHCGLVYMRPVDWDMLADLYANKYKYGRLGTERYPEASPWDIERRDWIDSYYPAADKVKILEIGCGAGKLLSSFDRNKFDITGIEPDKDSCAYAVNTRGLNVKNCFLEEADVPEGSVDVVVMISTLEHIQHPRPELERIARVLKDGGRLFLEIPNLDHKHGLCIDWTWLGFKPTCEHLFCYSDITIRAMLESCGYKVEYMGGIRENLLVVATPENIKKEVSFDSPERAIKTAKGFIRANRISAPLDTLRLILEKALIVCLPKGLVSKLRQMRKNKKKQSS